MSSGGEKGEFKGERNQKSNCKHPMGHRKSRGFQKSSYFYFIDYAKGFYCVDPNKMWKILKKKNGNTRTPYLPLEKLYAGQEATVRTGHGTTDWFQVGKGVCQG